MRNEPFGILRATLLGVLVVALPLAVRTHGITRDFWLMADQIRDWDLVQGSFASLPVTGTPRSGGGYHVGPAYYHFLWLCRVALAPLLGDLPHVAGIAISTLDALATGALATALWRIGVPYVAALALGLLLATNPYAAALARAAWNPALALAFANLGLAYFLLRRARWTLGRQLVLATTCWVAIEMHLAAFPLALCLIALGAAHAPGATPRACAALLGASALVVLALELPLLLVGPPGDAGAASSVSQSLARLAATPSVAWSARGLDFVIGDGAALLFAHAGSPTSLATAVLVAALLAGAWSVLGPRRDATLASVAYLPLAVAVAAFTVFDRELNAYWLVPLLGGYVLALGLALRAPPAAGLRRAAALASLVAVGLLLPARWAAFRVDHRYAFYGVLVDAAAALARDRVAVRALVGPVEALRPTSSSALVRWAGGTLDPAAPVEARVSAAGRVTLRPAAGG